MAIANEDGSIVLSLKISTQKAFENFKGKIAQIAKEKKGLTILVEETKRLQSQLTQLEKEYALLLAQEKVAGNDPTFATKMEHLQGSIERTKILLKETQDATKSLGKKATMSFDDMSKGLKNFGKRIAGIIKSALIFSLLYKVMQSVVKLFQNILMSDEEFRQDWEELKAAFYTAAYPIINLIAPAIKWIVQQVRDWAVSIGKVAAALQGMSYSELVDQAKASKEAADNYADMEKSSKKTADNVKKQLAGFDDIQILSSGNKEEQGAGLSGFEGLGQYDTSGEKSMLNDLMKAIGGALIAVGLILLFHGQLAWGIGFIIAGAVAGLFGVTIATLSDESVSQKAKDELSNAMLIVGIVAIVLGILLCMASQWGIGIGLMVIGVSSIVAPIALNWNGIKQKLQGSFGKWLAIGGIIAIVLGILLCFAQVWGLGIGLIVLGAGAVVAPIVANWNAIKEKIQKFFTENSGLIAGISAALLVLGIILCVFGVITPLTIGLIVAGAAGLTTVIVINKEAISKWIKDTWEDIKEWISKYGGLVLGIILVLTGVGLPLGLALIADSASSLGKGEKPALWSSLLESIKKTWSDIKAYWNANIANVWTLKFWLDLAKIAGNGLISGFEIAINGIIGMFEKMLNWIIEGINSIGFDVPDWLQGVLGTEHFGFNLSKVDFGEIKIPRLAQGAVIPGNRKFLAILGDQPAGQTNIEAPLQTIVDAFNIALSSWQGRNGGDNQPIVLEIDGEEFGRAVIKYGDRESRRTKTRFVTV